MTPTEPQEPIIEDAQQPEAQDFGPNNENLPDNLVQALKKTIIEIRSEQGYGKYLRRIEVMREWRNRLYEQGTQHVYWQGGQDGGGFAIVSSGGMVNVGQNQKIQAPKFVDDYDITGPYANILTAVQTQDKPDISFRPKNKNRPEDVAAQDEGECYRDIYDEQSDTSSTDVQIYRKLLLSGRCIAWTRTETDGELLGFNDNGEPNSFEVTSVHGTIDSWVPILAKNQKQCHCVILTDDIDVTVARANNPQFAEKIQGGADALGESKYERMARLGVLQNAGQVRGNAFPDLTARSNCWLRPSNWGRKSLSDEDKAQLKQMFPMGVRARFIGDVYTGSWHETMDDCLTIVGGIRPEEGMFQRALIDPIIVDQDALNDAMNTTRLIWEVGWPNTWWAAQETEYDAAADQVADPYAIRLLKDLPAGQNARDRFYREPDPSEPPTFTAYKESLRSEWPQFQLAAQPALFGAQMEDNKTASGYAQANKNALGTQGLAFRVKEGVWARIYYQAALACSRREASEPMVSSSGRVLDHGKLSKGKFGAFADRDSGFPESTQARRQIMQNLVAMAAQSPLGDQIFNTPENAKVFLDLNGFSELVIPEAEARDKQLTEIAELLKQSPIPPDPMMMEQVKEQYQQQTALAQQSGLPPPPPPPAPPPKSSITPDPLDFHFWEFAFCQDWLSGPDCRREMENGNSGGVANVRAHAMEHWDMKSQVQWPTGSPPAPMPLPNKPIPAQPGIGVPSAPSAQVALA